MDGITPPAQRQALAGKHRQAMGASAQRSRRQATRLRLLRLWGRRYSRAQPATLPRRILVIRPDHLGDLLLATPALHLLRASFPEAHIAALVGPWGEAVLAGNRDLDEILTCPFPGFTRQSTGSLLAPYSLLRAEAQHLAALRFDLALVLRFDHWWGAWLAAAAAIPRRLGYAIPEVKPFLTQAVDYPPGRHEVLQNVGLALAASGERWREGEPENGWRLRFEVQPADEARTARLLDDSGATETGPLIAIHPGSGAPVKRWRAEAWAELAGVLVRQRGAQIVFTGSTGEAELIRSVQDALPPGLLPRPVSLAGQTDLGSLAALYRRCRLVIGPDSGPLHLAVAVGAPTIHLYGPVDRRAFGPWGSPARHRVVTSNWACIPCNRLDWPEDRLHEHGCLQDIELEAVLAAIDGI